MSSPIETWPRRHRLTVAEYYRMAEVGLLAPDARVELIEGEIIDMAPIGARHGGTVDQLLELLTRAVAQRAILRVQGAVHLSDWSEPQPDLVLLERRADFYRSRHPLPEDILLLVEVSDTTLRYDRKVKMPLYARHGIPEVWIIDVERQKMHVARLPREGAYSDVSILRTPARCDIVALPGVAVDLTPLFA